MSQPFVGQIQPLGFGFAPRSWAQCNGQIMAIQQNAALFSLLGTMYGGNGTSTFGLPNLQSGVPMHYGTFNGNTYVQGEFGGTEQVSLTFSNLPMHNHNFVGGSQTGSDRTPVAGAALANVGGSPTAYYAANATPQPLNPAALATVGGNTPHPNIQPFQAINWCIALYGVYPSRS